MIHSFSKEKTDSLLNEYTDFTFDTFLHISTPFVFQCDISFSDPYFGRSLLHIGLHFPYVLPRLLPLCEVLADVLYFGILINSFSDWSKRFLWLDASSHGYETFRPNCYRLSIKKRSQSNFINSDFGLYQRVFCFDSILTLSLDDTFASFRNEAD